MDIAEGSGVVQCDRCEHRRCWRKDAACIDCEILHGSGDLVEQSVVGSPVPDYLAVTVENTPELCNGWNLDTLEVKIRRQRDPIRRRCEFRTIGHPIEEFFVV